MKIGRVVGNVVATVCQDVFARRKLLVCDLIDPDGEPTGSYTLAVDTVGAGAGERVLILDEGNSARQVVEEPEAPIRALVVGIVDAVDVDA